MVLFETEDESTMSFSPSVLLYMLVTQTEPPLTVLLLTLPKVLSVPKMETFTTLLKNTLPEPTE